MEQRLEDSLSRIALETQEIKELEQQLTNGQHLANVALRKDLWDVISGLQQLYTGQSEENKLPEVKPEIDLTRTPKSFKLKTEPRPRSRTKAKKERGNWEPGLRNPVKPRSGGEESLASQDSDQDRSAQENAQTTCAEGSCLCEKDRHNKTNHSQEDPRTRLCFAPDGPAEGPHRRKQDRLRSETEKLQRALRRLRRVLGVCEEVWCVEQTLLKRRAELRQAQRLLQEVHRSTAQAQSEAEVWQRRTKDSVSCLEQTQLQLRELQDEAETLRTSRGAQIQSPDHNSACSHCLDQLVSPRNQEKLLQQRTQELRNQETRLKTSLQLMVQQQELLLSQSSSLISATAEEEQQLEDLRSELDSTRTELKQLQEEVLLERQELEHLKTLQSENLQKLQKIQVQLNQTQVDLVQTKDLRDRTKDQAELSREELNQSRDQLDQTKSELNQSRDQLDQTKSELNQSRDQLDQTKSELKQSRDQLDQTKSKLLLTQNAVKQKEESVIQELREIDQSQAAVDKRRTDLSALEQEVEMRQKEAEAGLKETEQQLKEMKEEVEQTKAQNSSLQQQCRHLEDRRRHAHRCLSAVEVELQKLKQEHSQSLLTQQQVKQEVAANQEKLNESSELLSFLGEKVEERRIQLQISEQEWSRLSAKHTELLELENRAQSQTLASERDSENTRKHVTQEQLHKLSEELLEREKRLLEREAALTHQEDSVQEQKQLLSKEEDLLSKEEDLLSKEGDLLSEPDNSDEEFSRDFYLSTVGLRSTSSPEERWTVEEDKLELEQDSLKARLRCSFQTRDQSLQERDLETEQSLRGLRLRVDKLDSLLLRAKTHTSHD